MLTPGRRQDEANVLLKELAKSNHKLTSGDLLYITYLGLI